VAFALALLGLVLAAQTPSLLAGYRGIARDFESDRPLLGGSDFPAFFVGGKLMLSSGRSRMYEEQTQARAVLEVKGLGADLSQDSPWYRFYNPPAYALLLAPLSLLPVRTAFLVTVAVNAVALAALAGLMAVVLRGRRLLTGAALAALAAATPVMYAFWHAQPTLLLACILTGAFLLSQRGRPVAAGAALALAGVKPRWLAFPSLALVRTDRRALSTLLGATVVLLLPFLLLGVSGLRDYVALLRHRGHEDFYESDFAEALLSWGGFFRAYTGSVQPAPAAAMSLLTLLVAVPAWRSGRRDLLPMAAVLCTLLVGPHSHPQDWVMVAPAAGFMLREQRGARLLVTSCLLLAVEIAVNGWSAWEPEMMRYAPAPAAFALLLWTTFLALEVSMPRPSAPRHAGWRAPQGREPSPVP
jgi:hypothetical protein